MKITAVIHLHYSQLNINIGNKKLISCPLFSHSIAPAYRRVRVRGGVFAMVQRREDRASVPSQIASRRRAVCRRHRRARRQYAPTAYSVYHKKVSYIYSELAFVPHKWCDIYMDYAISVLNQIITRYKILGITIFDIFQ